VEEFKPGGYRFIPADFNFRAASRRCGLRDQALSLSRPDALMKGFARIEAIINRRRPAAHRILRLRAAPPGQFTEQGFP